MTLLDRRFLSPPPATLAWWSQRSQCERCRHFELPAMRSTVEWMGVRCRASMPTNGRQVSIKGHGHAGLYCIDARLPGEPCGPDAALFEEG